jgi:hypothetical protein
MDERARASTTGEAGEAGEAGRIVRLSRPDGLDVSAWLLADGSLHLYGQDAHPGGGSARSDHDYEYSFTVRPPDLPLLLRALGAAPEADVLASVAGSGLRMLEPGLGRWLWRAGIEPLFWHNLRDEGH